MSTTLHTPSIQHGMLGKAALWMALLALAVAVAGLAVAVANAPMFAGPTTAGTHEVVRIDTTDKVVGGFVRPFETRIEPAAISTPEGPALPAEYQDQPDAHLKHGPVF